MSFLDAFEISTRADPDLAEKTIPRDFGERFTLDWRAARSPDRSFFYDVRMHNLWEDALDKLRVATGKSYPNPAAFADPQSQLANVLRFGTRRDLDKEREALAAFDEARTAQFDLPDPRRFDDKVRGEATARRKEAQQAALASYGAGGLGAFLGASAGELSHPAQIVTLPLGASYAAANIARIGLLRFMGRAALTEGAVAGATQAGVEMFDAPLQAQLATDGPGSGNEFGDRIDRILFAAAGGALIGAGLAGLVGAARGVSRRLRPTLDEADALKVAERAVYGEQRNPLGPDGINAHTTALNKAEMDVAAGRHAQVDEIVREEVRRQVGPIERAASAQAPVEQPPEIAAPITGFTTAKGSTYTLEGATTIRDKAARAEHPGDQGIKDRSDVTVYVSPKDKEELGVKGLQGQWKVAKFDDGTIGITMWNEAKQAWGMSPGARVPFQTEPALGLHPVEVWGGAPGPSRSTVYPKIHVGNEITAIRQAEAAQPFDILDSGAATRPIVENAPLPPEKPPAGMKEAKADEARAMVLAKDFEVSVPSGDGFVKKMASEMLAEADDKVRAARIAAECAAGGAIG